MHLPNARGEHIALLVVYQGDIVGEKDRIVGVHGHSGPDVNKRGHHNMLDQELIRVLRIEVGVVQVAADALHDGLQK
jgi:hypothetical protein